MPTLELNGKPFAEQTGTGEPVLKGNLNFEGPIRINNQEVLSANGSISTSAAVFEGSSANAIVRITQTGAGNALVVEDSTNPDNTPFVVNASGNVGIGQSAPEDRVHVSGGNILINNSNTYRSKNSSGTPRNLLFLFSDDNVYHDSIDGGHYFRVGSNPYYVAMHINSSGNVGIGTGTSSPSEKLHINGSGQTLLVTPISFNANQDSAYLIAAPTTYSGASTNWGTYGFQHRIKSNAGGTARITVDTTYGEAFCIDNNNKVGIGTSSPNSLCEIRGSSNGQNVLHLSNSAGTSDGGAENQIRVTCNGNTNWGDLDIQAYRTIFTQNNTERMRIDSSGNVGLTGGGTLSFYSDASVVGSIVPSNNGTTYNTTSDFRLKDNIQPISDGTEKLMAMNPVSHTWKADPEAPSVHGFIAQEMVNIIPEAVSGTPDGEEMMTMDYGRITPVLVAALQDAHKKIKELETRLNTLEGG